MDQPKTENTEAWRAWLDNLANYKLVKDIGLVHAKMDHRTVDAQYAFRQVGEFLFYLITHDLMDTPAPDPTLTARVASEYKSYKQGRRKVTSKAATLIQAHLREDGTLDIQGVINDYMATSQKRNTWMAVYYSLGALNKDWQKEWQEKLPLGL